MKSDLENMDMFVLNTSQLLKVVIHVVAKEPLKLPTQQVQDQQYKVTWLCDAT